MIILLFIIELILIIYLVAISQSIIISNHRASGKNKFFGILICIGKHSISLGHLTALVFRPWLLKVWIRVLSPFHKSIWLKFEVWMNYWFPISSNMVFLCLFWRIIFINFFQIQNGVIILVYAVFWKTWMINLRTAESSLTWCSDDGWWHGLLLLWWWFSVSLIVEDNLRVKLWIVLVTCWRWTKIIYLLVQITSNIWERYFWSMLLRRLKFIVWKFSDGVVYSWRQRIFHWW